MLQIMQKKKKSCNGSAAIVRQVESCVAFHHFYRAFPSCLDLPCICSCRWDPVQFPQGWNTPQASCSSFWRRRLRWAARAPPARSCDTDFRKCHPARPWTAAEPRLSSRSGLFRSEGWRERLRRQQFQSQHDSEKLNAASVGLTSSGVDGAWSVYRPSVRCAHRGQLWQRWPVLTL